MGKGTLVAAAVAVALASLALHAIFNGTAQFRSLAATDLPPQLKAWKAGGRDMFLSTKILRERRGPSSSKTSAAPSSSTKDEGGYLIWYMDVNSTSTDHEQRTLVCLHGFPTSSFDWTEVLPDLASLFSRVILFDFLGFGLSEKPFGHQYSIMEQTDITEALLMQLGVKEVHVLAHDYGVSVAQELLARHQERIQNGDDALRILSVGFLNGGLFPGAHKPRPIQRVMSYPYIGPLLSHLANYYTFASAFVAVFGPETAPSEEELQELWSLVAFEGGHRLSSALLGYMADRVQHQHRWLSALKETNVPLRLINGPADPVSGRHLAERYAVEVPDADVVLLADAIGHYPQLEAPRETMDAFRAFHANIVSASS